MNNRCRTLQLQGTLSRSEAIVASLASAGLRNEEIAKRLHRRTGTIKNQLSSAYRKTGVRNRVELTRFLMAANETASRELASGAEEMKIAGPRRL
jgi:DNA-binding NarL/FixJ family response regulator